MGTIDVNPVRKEARSPAERHITSRELRQFLTVVRRKSFTNETFRQWRGVAKVTSRGLYTGFERDRLALVALYMLEGKSRRDMGLKVRIKLLLNKEKGFSESTASN